MPAACEAVRDHLAEHAVGVLSERDRRAVERHLEWCAACRKEAEELSGAAAILPYALDPAPLPEGLLARVLAQIARLVRAPAFRKRTRAAASVAIAAMVAVSALGWGAVMAGRAERFQVLARQEADRQTTALLRFQKMFGTFQGRLGTGLRSDDARLARLAPTGTNVGGGAALQLVSESMLDFVMVHVSGLAPDGSALPYRVWLVDAQGNAIRAGRLTTLNASGGGSVFHEFDRDLTPYTAVVVRDATGAVVLRGAVEDVNA
jgi:Putative zinc-finger/Anti-sigma-K factor rskA, C-terminal